MALPTTADVIAGDYTCFTPFIEVPTKSTINLQTDDYTYQGMFVRNTVSAATTNIKTFYGLAYASTKTVLGLTVANVKTWVGLG